MRARIGLISQIVLLSLGFTPCISLLLAGLKDFTTSLAFHKLPSVNYELKLDIKDRDYLLVDEG
ncbi:hypothetical protein BFU36_01390 [Sulfolobus sp. A20]|uniref:hypothetical protein n=1 Tax=Sulfolobaceae TaxID=118883 RepID=UPI000845F706|nr:MULTISPECIES: hypothetical protein [unclassified Sulfolobus]TRM75772.1 hypothetical protein DJ528_09040 [Sulfolobus sp. B5]TRM77190.1 hypothetical protein DJ532_05650 [Sulfolobus sp. A20-N-F8]TRM84459.1 hypothetical protein DJ522_04650 [Sulfolobus sp. F3]TRM87843.1 hypothetical protein DJ529_07260 [Sulfolobus sp. C3]TRM97922.1 hypothetical protein DJ530_11745 [Sulfolobus sp. E1]TRN02565.1 hypothetical protein DJ527_03500 [Sulfolobus sp. F1]